MQPSSEAASSTTPETPRARKGASWLRWSSLPTVARRSILLVMLAGNLLPPQILLIPVSRIAQSLGIYDTLFALVVVQVGFGLGFYTFVLHGFMRALPSEVFKAALLDGSGPGRTHGVS